MLEFLRIVAVALLPALGSALGILVAELSRAPGWVVGAALHGAAGIAIALVTVELAPQVLDATPAWLDAALFACGALLSLMLARLVDWVRGSRPRASSGGWMVYLATAIDLLSDGMMVGASSAASRRLGVLLGVSQVVANIPGGFATVANLRSNGVARRTRLLAALSLVLPVLLGALLGYGLLRGRAEVVQAGALAVVIGVLLLSTVEDLVPQADAPGTARWLSSAAFAGGYCFFLLLSEYVA